MYTEMALKPLTDTLILIGVLSCHSSNKNKKSKTSRQQDGSDTRKIRMICYLKVKERVGTGRSPLGTNPDQVPLGQGS
jgi:hypothetical protein